MNSIRLAVTFLAHKPLFTAIVVVFILIPVIVITGVVLFSQQAKIYFKNSTGEINLILSARATSSDILKKTVFLGESHLKNLKLNEAREAINNPEVKLAVPVYIDDYYMGHALIGTNKEYKKIFNLELERGSWWKSDFEAVLGNTVSRRTGLKKGSTFTFPSDSVSASAQKKTFVVSGILKKSNSTIDNAIITSLESTWALQPLLKDSVESNTVSDFEKITGGKSNLNFPDSSERIITAAYIVLKKSSSPEAFINQGNFQTGIQAIEPAVEMKEDYQSLQFTLSALIGAGFSVLIIGLLALFIRLFYFIRERSRDLLLLRKIGASGNMIMTIVLLQGLLITDMAVFSGILLAHGALGIMSTIPEMEMHYGVTGSHISWYEVFIYLGVIASGFLVSLFPAIKARNIHTLLFSADF